MTAAIPAPAELAFIDSTPAVAAVGHPERRALLEALADRPDSSSGLAARIGDRRQRINYHLKALETAGLVELAEERPRRGLTERVFRPTARSFVIDPAVLGPLDAGTMAEEGEGDRWSARYAIALAARATREIAALESKARTGKKRLATASLDTIVHLKNPGAMAAFVEDLACAVAQVVARHQDPGCGARPFRVSCSSWPAPSGAARDPSPTHASSTKERSLHGHDSDHPVRHRDH